MSNQLPISKINLFDFLHCFFRNPRKYELLTDSAKKPNMFMLFRILSSMYPAQIHNVGKCYSIEMMDAFHKILSTNNPSGRIPDEVNKVLTRSKPKTTKFSSISTDAKKLYAKNIGIEYKELEFMYSLYPQKVINGCSKLTELLNH